MKYSVQHLLLYHQHLRQVTGGAYQILFQRDVENSARKVNGKVIFWKFQPKIEDNNFQKSFHSGWLNQVEYYTPTANFFRFQTSAAQIWPLLDSNDNRCSSSTVDW